jgi:hypothetical protein
MDKYEAACYIVDDLKRYKEWYIVEDKTDLLSLWLYMSDGEWADYAEHFKVSFPAKVQVHFYWATGDDIPTAQLKVFNPSRLDSFKLKLGLIQKRFQGQSVSWDTERK